MKTDGSLAVSDLTVQEFQNDLADRSVYCGGGSAAAVSASSAAALVVLVLTLNARRKSNAHARAGIEEAIDDVSSLQSRLLQAADMDKQALARLMSSQSNLKDSNDRSDYVSALISAAEAPLTIARDAQSLLMIIESHLDSASRFTVSDLGAAASIALGALQAATMMSEVNLSLLDTEKLADAGHAAELRAELDQLNSDAAQVAARILLQTRSAIRQEG